VEAEQPRPAPTAVPSPEVDERLAAGLAHHQAGRAGDAERLYLQALTERPAESAALFLLGRLLLETGRAAQAEIVLKVVVDSRADHIEARLALAEAFEAQGQLAEAAQAYRDLIDRDPTALRAHLGLAIALIQLGERPGALAVLDSALALDPSSADAWFVRAIASEGDAAIAALERAVALDPGRAAAHLALGEAQAKQGRAEAAEHSLKRAIALAPANAQAHASLGGVYLASDRPGLAQAAYEAALRIDPDMIEAHQHMAAILTEFGDRAAARRHCDLAYGRQNLFIEDTPRARRRVLILINVGTGNIPFQHLAPPERYTRINWFIAYAKPGQAAELPDHDVVLNAIGEPDESAPARANLNAFVQVARRTVLNDPAKVALTSRHMTPQRLAGLADVVTPMTIQVSSDLDATGLAAAADAAGIGYPLIFRPTGSHGGKGLILAHGAEALRAAVFGPDGRAYLTAFQDYQSPDGYYRKYRMIFIDRRPYPYHLAISPRWLVHHASADMAADRARIEEEWAFLRDPAAAIGARALTAVEAIGRRLDLDYAGLDFSVLPDGQVLVFEANATMLVHPEAEDGPFAHKNSFVTTILEAFQHRLETA
jgi:tetratricopeptide (TPR) repeat protein/glutathione synthase/RimK-type ligase-like ATP-grasp enzyme